MNIKISFEEWMANYAPNNYFPSTIKSYIRSLNKIPEILGITLDKPVLECTTVEDYIAIYDIVVNADDFAKKNRNYNHGSISAALNAYRKYVLFSCLGCGCVGAYYNTQANVHTHTHP